ncbi:MAG: hypothetical protein C0626_05890 [Arcobacter sp.]|uniref:phytanoyl-CoA dioxygenase family protein n=1 Tax=uncultured Arcobacter sp. TaxID=165434 RepID=UPI000CB88FD8|nr:phytanoyl-CoA dioxygenase family protein [uncultured Arcobacter sp.]PLY10505.1 MAG: hypothetical protein C0626_05890 [Arcobacter sp.]
MLIKKFVKSLPITYELVRKSIYKKKAYKLDSSLTKSKDILETLLKDGIAVIPSYYDTETVDNIVNDLYPSMEQLSKVEKDAVRVLDGQFRLDNADLKNKYAKDFFDDQDIYDIAKAYVSKDVKSEFRIADYSNKIGAFGRSDSWHFDDIIHRFKAFLYLSDVDERNAPFIYLVGSHKDEAWRYPQEHIYWQHDLDGSLNCFHPHQVERLKTKFGFKEKIFTGKKGDVILVDTKGLHRRGALHEGERLILVNYFEV